MRSCFIDNTNMLQAERSDGLMSTRFTSPSCFADQVKTLDESSLELHCSSDCDLRILTWFDGYHIGHGGRAL